MNGKVLILSLSLSLLLFFLGCPAQLTKIDLETDADRLMAAMVSEIWSILQEGGPQTLLPYASINPHEGIFSLKELDMGSGIVPDKIRSIMVSGKREIDMPLEVYIWIPGLSGIYEKAAALEILSYYDAWGLGCPPCLTEDNYDTIDIIMNTGEVVTVSVYEEQDFPIIVVDRSETALESNLVITRGPAISIKMNYVRAYWPSNIDPWWRPQPEVYCCARPNGYDSWRINSGTNPWGGINLSGIEYPFTTAVEIFDHHKDISFDIQFRDMDGVIPNPSKKIDDSIGQYDNISSSALSSTAVLFHTNLDVTDDNSATTVTSSHTYFKIYKE